MPVKVNEDGVEEVDHRDPAFSACIPTADDFYWSIRTHDIFFFEGLRKRALRDTLRAVGWALSVIQQGIDPSMISGVDALWREQEVARRYVIARTSGVERVHAHRGTVVALLYLTQEPQYRIQGDVVRVLTERGYRIDTYDLICSWGPTDMEVREFAVVLPETAEEEARHPSRVRVKDGKVQVFLGSGTPTKDAP